MIEVGLRHVVFDALKRWRESGGWGLVVGFVRNNLEGPKLRTLCVWTHVARGNGRSGEHAFSMEIDPRRLRAIEGFADMK